CLQDNGRCARPHAVGNGASEEGSWAGSSDSPSRFHHKSPAARGRICVRFLWAKGRRCVGRRRFFSNFERRTMLRRNFVGIISLGLLWTIAVGAQVKEMPKTPVKPINAPKAIDINSAAESEIVALGIAGPVAKKIVEGRPYRSKRDLVTRQVLTEDQYEKFKDSLVARRPKNTKK